MNAVPKRVRAIGVRSPYSSRPKGNWSASSARNRNAAMPMFSAATTPAPVSRKNRPSARGDIGERTTSKRKQRPPTTSASERK
jgi:hypothetical protein